MSKFNVPLNEPQKDRFRDRLDADSASDSRIRQQYIKDGAFEKFKDNYLKETKTFIGIVIKVEENAKSAEFLTRINPFAKNQKKFVAVRVRIPQLHSMIPEPCGLGTDKGAEKKGIFEMHPLFVGHVDEERPDVGDYVQVSFKKGPSGGNQKEGIFHKVYQKNQPPAGADNDCDKLVSAFETADNRQSVGETVGDGLDGVSGITPEEARRVSISQEDMFPATPLNVPHPVTSEFGTLRTLSTGPNIHRGIDFGKLSDSNPIDGKDVFSMADGKVTVVDRRSTSGAGNYVEVETGDLKVRYLHLQDDSIPTNIQIGNNVSAGSVLGKVGNTGASEGAHLHIDMRLKNEPVRGDRINPRKYMNIQSFISSQQTIPAGTQDEG